MSWNSMTRRLAFAGSLRTELWPSARRSASRVEPFASSASLRVALIVLLSPNPDRRSGLHVRLDVPPHFAARRAAAIGFLLHVFDMELGEVESQALRDELRPVSSVLHTADEDIGQLDLQVLERLVARLAYRHQPGRDVLAARAVQEQCSRSLVHKLRNADVVHGNLAGAAAAAR